MWYTYDDRISIIVSLINPIVRAMLDDFPFALFPLVVVWHYNSVKIFLRAFVNLSLTVISQEMPNVLRENFERSTLGKFVPSVHPAV